MLGNFKKFALVVGDVLALYLSLYLTLALRYRSLPSSEVWNENFLPFTLLFAVWLVIFYINGLYDIAATKNDIGFYNKIFRNILINYAVAGAYFYLLTDKLFDIKPRAVFFIFMAVFLGLNLLWRFWFNAFVQRPNFLKNILVIGMKDEARELVEEIFKKPQLGYRIAAIINDNSVNHKEFPGVAFYDSSTDIKKILRSHQISTVVTAIDPHGNPDLAQNLFSSLSLKIQFFDLPGFYEKLTGKIPVTSVGHVWFLQNFAQGEQGPYEFAKRILDITVSAVVLLASLPFLPLVALAIKLNSPGRVLFRQTRVGFLGRPFVAIKFRSMKEEAEKDSGPQWATKNDPRVTGFGRFLRKMRLDEIPQFINVLAGEMSLIGPRPERPEFVKSLVRDIPFYNERHLVKPGLTGWAQVNYDYGASVEDAHVKLQYDIYYAKKRSLVLDLAVLLKTAKIILTRQGK